MSYFIKIIGSLLLGLTLTHANAASLSFDMPTYSAAAGSQISVSVVYDFNDTPTFGGGFNVLYDVNVLEFVSYTKAPVGGAYSHDPAWSPTGVLDSPGHYLNAGIHAFGKTAWSYINTSGTAGTFVFNVIGQGGDGGCGSTLC